MFPKQKPIEKGNSMENKFKVRSKSHIISIGEKHTSFPFPKLHFIGKGRKQIVAITVFLMLFSFCLPQFLYSIEAVEPSVEYLGSEMYKTTWIFEDATSFNATEATIANGEVKLKPYNYTWNQTTKKDFERGIIDNVTVTQNSITVEVESWNFESDNGGWERGTISGGSNEWQYGDISVIPGFIGAHDSGEKVWGTNLEGKYDDSGGIARDYFLRSPIIHLTNYENIEMSFWHYYDFENDVDFFDGGRVEVSTDNGMSWQPISPLLGYDGPIVSEANPLYGKYCFAGNSTTWVEERFDLSQFDGVQDFRIRFHFATNGQISGYGWYIDDITITSTEVLDGEVELEIEKIIEMGNPPANIIQTDANTTIINYNNPANANGKLTKWTVYTATNGSGKMKIFREVGGEFVFVDETELEKVTRGENTFDCLIDVKAGDYIGWYGENAEIFAESGGSAFSMPDDIHETHPISSWTPISYNLSIRAVGMSRYPVGIFTSQVLNAGSSATWVEIKWGGNFSYPGVDIILQTRTGNSLVPDSSWSPWSPSLSNPSGSQIESPNAQYLQFKATLTTEQQPNTPTLYYVSVFYRKYSPHGYVETKDFIPVDDDSNPKDVVQWKEFYADEKLNGQYIEYSYSLDSGETWHSIPENGVLTSLSVLERKIRFKVDLTTEDTTISPVIGEMSLIYSCAKPEMWLSIEADKNKAKSGDTISFTIYYDNRDIGNATDVFITFKFDQNLSFVSDDSPVSSTIENDNARKWHFETLAPGKRSFIVVTKVKEISKETTISTSAVLNYTDIGGNSYPMVTSNEITIKVTINQDLNPYYILLSGIIVIIIISFMVLAIKRLKTKQKFEERIALEDVEKGIGYLLMEENPIKSYTLFSDLIDKGNEGLCITRTFPGRVLTSYYFEGVSLLWLSRSRDDNSILPTNLGAVLRNAKEFMEQNKNPVILLDGLEYLIVHNDFPRVLKLVHGLNELTAINDAVLIMPLNPLTLDEDKVALLKRDLKVIG
jgi:hypothetical protein